MTPVIVAWFPALVAGLLAGTLYFAGLWWTVRRLNTSRRPSLLMAASFALRAALAAGVFYLVGKGHGDRLLVCLAGFLLARWLITRRIRPHGPGKGKRRLSGLPGMPGRTDG